MTDQPMLPLLVGMERRYDLPPKWDGRDVDWGPWHPEPTNLCAKAPRSCCEFCGSFDQRAMASGRVKPEPGETFPSTRVKRTRSGREYEIAVEVPAWPVIRFTAWRCQQCSLDVVWDHDTDQWWTLEESDYGLDGSTG